jgi:hypothetical protein
MDSTDGQIAAKKTRAVPGESKRERFLRLMQPRVTRAMHAIHVIGLIGGANRYHYEYGQGDVDEIVQALDASVTQLRDKLGKKPVQKKFEFGGQK